MSSPTYRPFNPLKAPLYHSNLIEASAGTGKTYSIAIMVLRLLLEHKARIEQVLMVTFTKAAVAELEARVRLFVRQAYKASKGKAIDDPHIAALVAMHIAQEGEESVQQTLRTAVLWLDDTAIMTIHSFCQNVLTEFAFETNQVFGAELMPDVQELLQRAFNDFWRKHITTLPTALLQETQGVLLRHELYDLIENHLDGKHYADYDAQKEYHLPPSFWQQATQSTIQHREAITQAEENLVAYVAQNRDAIMITASQDKHAQKALSPNKDNHELATTAIEKVGTDYLKKLFPEMVALVHEYQEASLRAQDAMIELFIPLKCLAIQVVSKALAAAKQKHSLITYNDLISLVHQAINGANGAALSEALQKKYKAVFIDEFQDTDSEQYEVFDKAFGKHTVLFFIGDPKQSIYGWRKADMHTYFAARNKVRYLYTMNENYRSTEGLIEAMNFFFKPTANFDTFHYERQSEGISYFPVASPQPNTKGYIQYKGKPQPTIVLAEGKAKVNVDHSLVKFVAALLRDSDYTLVKGNLTRTIQPSDIGILVRNKKRGVALQKALAKVGIAAITMQDLKVLHSSEALYVYHLLEAIRLPTVSAIRRALLSPITQMDATQVLSINEDITILQFEAYRNLWEDEGIFSAIKKWLRDYDLEQRLVHDHINGQRLLGNLYHIIELAHQAQQRNNFSIAEVLVWLKRSIGGKENDGDEYLQRMESDDNAVKIVTIHKSKGLEYPIVFCPELDLKIKEPNNTSKTVVFRDMHRQCYVSKEWIRLDGDERSWYRQQQEQENRRLLYVSITRAVYQCYIFSHTGNAYSATTLKYFLNDLNTSGTNQIALQDAPRYLASREESNELLTEEDILPPAKINPLQPYWRRMSFSSLADKATHLPRPRNTALPEAYDQFVFNTLRAGAQTGDLLHEIFERITFNYDTTWPHAIEAAIAKYVPHKQETYADNLLTLLHHVLHTTITIGNHSFTLADISRKHSIAEMEFNFPVQEFALSRLNSLSTNSVQLAASLPEELAWARTEGLMTGKMDLFFEHQGKYYILDWKSNYLGFQLQDYEQSQLAHAMNEHNYHLQYLIYAIAIKKYLTASNLPIKWPEQFGGVIYLFVRGLRQGSTTGIFTTRPSADTLRKMEHLFSGG